MPRTTKQSTDRIDKRIDLRAPRARVWRALTDHREFSAWFGVDLEAAFAVGEATVGRITTPGYEHLSIEVVTEELVAERLFSFRWHPYAVDPDHDYASETMTLVEFRLEDTARGTRLFVTESGFDALPAERRDEAWRMNSGGWEQQIRNIECHVDEGR